MELPSVQPPVLALTVSHADGARLTLDWSIVYAAAESTGDAVTEGRRVPMSGAGREPGGGDRGDKAAQFCIGHGLSSKFVVFQIIR